ncbi:MAG TPA: hypothetical protein VF450_03815 [Noviherbaspirillum sp.]
MEYGLASLSNLAQRALELSVLNLPGASISFHSGRELQYRFAIAPSACSRLYECLLRIKPDARSPEMFVLSPDLKAIAGEQRIPHIYPHDGTGTKLCLWWPKQRNWKPQMKLVETYIPWTAEWLWYFEDWLGTGVWSGGGEHPDIQKRLRKSKPLPPV